MTLHNRAARRLLLPVAILLIAALLRFHLLDGQSFWNDEGNSARLSERTIRLILEGTASDVHPPLYYVLLRGWRELVGETEFGLRSLSAFAGVLTVAGAWALVRLGGWRTPRSDRTVAALVAAIAALLVAVSPALVYYGQEARMYALLACFATLATVLLLRWLRTGQWRFVAGYLLLLAAGLYTHYFFPVVIGMHAVLLLWWAIAERENVGNRPIQSPPVAMLPPLRSVWIVGAVWGAAVLGALLLYLPWLPIALRQVSAGNPAVALTAFLADFGRFLSAGPTVSPDVATAAAIAVLFSVALGALAGRRAVARFAGYGAIGVLIPLAAMAVTGATVAQFYKFGLLIIIPLAALIAYGWVSAWRTARPVRYPLRLGVAVLALTLGFGIWQALDNMYTDPQYARADYRSMAQRITEADHPDAAILLNAPNQWEVFTYYYGDEAPVYPIPRGWPDPVAIEQELRGIATAHDRLYVLFWGEKQRDPDGLVEAWLNNNMFPVSSEWVGDVRFAQFAVAPPAAETMQSALGLPFGAAIELDGFTLAADGPFQPGDVVGVTLFWRALADVAERYKVFVHVQDFGGTPLAQRDSEPLGGLAPTSEWRAGDTFRDRYGVPLPLDLAPGAYRLTVGMYDINDPTRRVPITTSSGDVGAYTLATIVVE